MRLPIELKLELYAIPLHKLTATNIIDPYNTIYAVADKFPKLNLKRFVKPVLSADELFNEIIMDSLEPIILKGESTVYA